VSDDGPQREMTLDEWVGRLPSIHLAARELARLQARAALFEEMREALRWVIGSTDAEVIKRARALLERADALDKP